MTDAAAAAAAAGDDPCAHPIEMRFQNRAGWGDLWLTAGFKMAYNLVFARPITFHRWYSRTRKVYYFYYAGHASTPKAAPPACAAADWTCYVHTLGGCRPRPDAELGWDGVRDAPFFLSSSYAPRMAADERERFHAIEAAVEARVELGRAKAPGHAGHRALLASGRLWATRPNRATARRVRARAALAGLRWPCAAFHVRRGDVKTHRRRVYPLARYVAAAGGAAFLRRTFKSVLLMTDGQGAVDEARAEFPGLPWVVLPKPRVAPQPSGARAGPSPVAFGAHFPSGDPALEVEVISAELALAASCDLLAHGRSAFAGMIWDGMCAARGWRGCAGLSRAVCEGSCCKYAKKSSKNDPGERQHFDLDAQRCVPDSPARFYAQQPRERRDAAGCRPAPRERGGNFTLVGCDPTRDPAIRDSRSEWPCFTGKWKC